MAITSAEKRCGKSQYLEAAEYLVRYPLKADDISAAALYRAIEKYRPTMLLDEQDAAKNGDKEKYEALRGCLNSGAKYNGKVIRTVGKGKDMDVQSFSTFCPKALAGIGSLPDTVADRSIPIRLKRKLPSEKVDYLDDDLVRPVAESLRQRITRWVELIQVRLKGARPQMPGELNDRQKDGARPLLAIADAAGDGWAEKARKAIVAVHSGGASQDQSQPTQLLADIRSIFDAADADKIPTENMISSLNEIQTSPWGEWNRGKGLTPHTLSRLLKPFGVYPKTIRVGESTPKGYEREQFTDSFARYLPCALYPPSESATSPQPASLLHETHFSTRNTDRHVADPKSAPNPHEYCIVADVADRKGGDELLDAAEADGEGHQDLRERLCATHGFHRSWVRRGEVWNCLQCWPKKRQPQILESQ
jgi:hypothetical protein